MANYYLTDYDNESGGPFGAEGANITWAGGVGFLVTLVDRGLVGRLYIALVSGTPPNDNDILTQGTTTADTNGNAILLDFPAYFRNDVALASTGIISWTGPASPLVTHSFLFDAQTTNIVNDEILTFSTGETAQVISFIDNIASGEIFARFISNIDQGLPLDNATFTGSLGGDGTVNGVIHPRSYSPYEEHRLLQNLNQNGDIAGDDDLSRVDPIASAKDTNSIVRLLGNIANTDEVSEHMYGGSIEQNNGLTVYGGYNLKVTTPNSNTQPILIQNDVIITDVWRNALNPDSIKGNIRKLIKIKENGVDIDGRRIKGKLSEYGDNFFIGDTTLDISETQLALFSSPDGNNATPAATVSGAPYNTVVLTEGYQILDFNNGNGLTPFGLSMDFGSANSAQAYERSKYIPRRGTSELLFGRNATFFDGMNLNFAYDGEVGGPFAEDEIIAWGTVMTYTGQGATSLIIGEVVTFSGGSRGRLIYQNDAGATGTLIFDMAGNDLPLTTETMTGLTSGGNGTLGAVGPNTIAGTATLVALDDQGLTGNMYCSQLTGVTPADNSEIYGSVSNSNCLINGIVSTRTINNHFIGPYTGTNYQTNFGVAIDPTDAIVGDKLRNLFNIDQAPPNNQSGLVGGMAIGDTVTCFPWDGSSLDVIGNALPSFSEMSLATALTTASTTVEVGAGNIPVNTPTAGGLMIRRDSDTNEDLVMYSSYVSATGIFTLVSTAPSNASVANNVMRSLINEEITAGSQASYTAVKGAGITQVAIVVQNGYTAAKNGPIKPYPTTAIFGNGGFSVTATRNSDA